MANTYVEYSESDDEEKRLNLLDVIDEKNRAANKKSLLHRIVVISKLRNQNYPQTGGHYEKLFRDLQFQLQCEAATGLLLLYPQHAVHVVEAPTELIIEYVRDLRKDSRQYVGNVEVSKILVISHDIPFRFYSNWAFQTLDIQATDMDTYEPTESLEKVVIDILTQLLKLGTYISKQPKGSQKIIYESLFERVPDFLPQQAAISYLLSAEVICILTPDDFLRKYDLPYDTRMAVDKIIYANQSSHFVFNSLFYGEPVDDLALVAINTIKLWHTANKMGSRVV